MNIPAFVYEDVIKRAFMEDLYYSDITTDNLIPEEQVSEAYFMAKDDGVLCGIEIALHTLKMLDPELSAEVLKQDGDRLSKSDIIARVKGKTRALLKGERTALNLLQHMSGIATATERAVAEVAGTDTIITETRKTLPGLRTLEKYSVRVGGGKNHRLSLYDAVMIKDNHVDAVGSIEKAVNTVREHIGHTVKIEVETRTLDEVRQALKAKADIIMLDNMSPEQMKEAVNVISGNAVVEASGGIKSGMLRKIAETGVDVISIGALTHSVMAFDISMKIK